MTGEFQEILAKSFDEFCKRKDIKMLFQRLMNG